MSSSGRQGADREAAVTSVIGAVLALVVSVAGLGLTMLMGAPLMERLQDQSAAESAVGRFDALQDAVWRLAVAHEGLSIPLDPIGGIIQIESGTRVVIIVGLEEGRVQANTPCAATISEWVDGDEEFIFQTDCKEPQKRGAGQTEGRGNPNKDRDTSCGNGNGNDKKDKPCGKGGGKKGTGADCGKVKANNGCLQAYSIPNYGTDHVANISKIAGPEGKYRVQLDQDLEGGEWLLQLTSDVAETDNQGNPIPPDVYAQVWILSQDRLRWSRPGQGGTVEAMMESGAMFADVGRGGDQLHSPLPMTEGGAGDGTYFLRLVTLDANGIRQSTASSSAELQTALSDGFIRAAYVDNEVDTLRLQFAGKLARAWCESLERRNGDLDMPDGFGYTVDSACATGQTSDAGVRSILYRRDDAPTTPFSFVFTEVQLDVRLNP